MRTYRFLLKHILALALLAPILIMGAYFIGCGVYPFGKSSLLTVDMGQQYIDFYSYFRETVFGHPGQLFFAFNKDLGGDMYGVFAYYLLSPFNFIVCLFPKSMLDVAIAAITLAKYGCASLAMAFYLKHRGWSGFWLPGFGTVYALSGWMIANQLNLMWFDVVICLPLVAYGVDLIVERHRPWPFIWWLLVALITNYYMAWMLCLFIIGYFGYANCRDWAGPKHALQAIWRFASGALLAGGMAAVVLLPTLFQLTQSKGTYTVTKMTWKFEYKPYKLLGKFFTGSFNFDQMPSGQANLFVGSLIVIGLILYFVVAKIHWQERLFALAWTIFLTLSMMVEPLDLFWHGMQFPVWYPYRFSFVVVFWLMVLGTRALKLLPQGISWWQLLICLAVILGVAAFVWLHPKAFTYLKDSQILTTVIFSLFALLLLTLRDDQKPITAIMFCVLMLAESATNATITLNQLSYVSHSDYHTYTETLRSGVNAIQAKHKGTYRIGKTMLRTKNDAMQIGYMGTDQFNSMFEPSVPKLFGELGQSAGDGFVAYTNGTVITDAFLDLKYWLNPKFDASTSVPFIPQVSERPDLFGYGNTGYTKIGHTKDLALYQNPYALGLGFAASTQILKTKLLDGMPIVNQELLLSALTGTNFQTLFHKQYLSEPILKEAAWSGATVKKKTSGAIATVTYTFTATSRNPYYLQIPSTFTDSVVSLTQNGHTVPIYDTFRDPELLNVTPSAPGKKQMLVFTLLKDSADFGQLQLYHLDQATVAKKLQALQTSPWHITKRGDRSLAGKITIKQSRQVLQTTLPNIAGWQVQVDGKPVKPKTSLGLFMTIPLSKGKHHITMVYTPPYLWWGLLITTICANLVGLWWLFTPTGKHRRH